MTPFDLETMYYATWRDGAFDADPDDVYAVADAVGAQFPSLKDDVLDRYVKHQTRLMASVGDAADREAERAAARGLDAIADRLNIPREDARSAIDSALGGRPLAFDRMMSDYYGR